jgi:HD superfamily phosphodiesterase
VQLARNWRLVLILGIAASLPFVTWIVYLDADTAGSMMHFYYVPILVAAIFLGDVPGMVTAIAAAIFSIFPPLVLRVEPVEPLVGIFVRLCFFYALAILAARLSAQFQVRAQELSSLLSVSRAVNASHGLPEVFQTIVDKAVDLTGAKAAAISLLTPDHRHLVFEASRGFEQDPLGKPLMSLTDEQVSQAVSLRKPTLVRDSATCVVPEWRDYAQSEGIKSLACVPVIMRDRPFGVLCIYTAEPTRFRRRDIRLLEAFADQAAVAIENARLYDDVRGSYWHTVRALARAIEAKDPYTLGHSERVTEYAMRMGGQLRLPVADLDTVRFGGILHDVGKIGVAEHALNSAVTLSAQDQMLTRLHPLIGKSILEPVEFLTPATDIVLYHHEHLDGSGYPEELKGDDIPPLARLVAVANAYDNLTNATAERPALDQAQAISELRRYAGTHYDPEMVDALERVLQRED